MSKRPCVASVLLGTTTVRQVEEGVAACGRELPEAALEAVEVLHERTRNPGVYLADKLAYHTAPWLAEEEDDGDGARGRQVLACRKFPGGFTPWQLP